MSLAAIQNGGVSPTSVPRHLAFSGALTPRWSRALEALHFGLDNLLDDFSCVWVGVAGEAYQIV